MKQITVTQMFVISDNKLDLSKDINHISDDYLSAQGTRINKHVECQQLYNVQVDPKLCMGECTPDGFLTFCHEKINYTRGQAMKKARVFNGKVIKCND